MKGTKNWSMALVCAFFLACAFLPAGCGKSPDTAPFVVVYASQDQVHAEPVLRHFTEQTGIEVRPVYDSEAVKTVGLVNRLLNERMNPSCDVFWNNEEFRTRQLAAQGVLDPGTKSVSFGYRSRRIIYNTNLVTAANAPRSFAEIVKPSWRGKVALTYPVFGSTATHFLALRDHWGLARWETWCRELVQNEPLIVDGNSLVVQLVGRGEAALGLTDSDDFAAGLGQGLPLAAVPLGEDSLLIPNTVSLIRNAPHPDPARQFLEFMGRPEVAAELKRVQAIEGLNRGDVRELTLAPNWDAVLQDFDEAVELLKTLFLR